MRRSAAFSFVSDLALGELRDRLNARGTLRWIDRDSDRYGEYVSARVHPQDAFYKVFVDDSAAGRRYVLTIQLDADEAVLEERMAELERRALDELLPSVAARDVARTEIWD